MGIKQRLVERWVGDAADGYEGQAARLREAIDDLEMQLLQAEDLKWRRLSGSGEAYEFSQDARERMNELALLYWLKNPLAGRAVETMTHYTFGRGVTITAESDRAKQLVTSFMEDEDNKAELTSHQAQEEKSNELQVFGNVFLVFFVDGAGGVKLQSIADNEVKDIILDPENSHRPLTYKRSKAARAYNYDSHSYSAGGSDFVYHAHWRNPDDKNADADGLVYHIAVNKLSKMKFGISELYRAMDWLRAYNKFLENWASITAALARFAWKKKMKGGPTTVAAAAAAAQSGLAGGLGYENNPAPAAGSTLFENYGSDMQPIKTAGITTSPADGRRLMLMVCAATGVFEHYMGDPSTGNLATTTAMELPMLKMFESRQQLWADVFSDVIHFAIGQAGVKLEDPDEIKVVMPPIIQKDVPAMVKAIVEAVSLGQAGSTDGLLPKREATRMTLNAFGFDNPDQVISEMYPKGKVPESEQRDFIQKTQAMAESIAQIIESHGGY